MRSVHCFPNQSYSPMNSPWKYNREGITWSSGNIQINYKQGLVCWKLCIQECLSTTQQVYSSFEAWQVSPCWGEAIPSNCGKSLCESKMTSSWQLMDVSTQIGPSRAGRRKTAKTPSKRQNRACNSDSEIAKGLTLQCSQTPKNNLDNNCCRQVSVYSTNWSQMPHKLWLISSSQPHILSAMMLPSY